jgi:LEA14-like dessication related protein
MLKVLIPIENENQTLKQIIEADVPGGIEYRIIDREDLPEDRTFRDAWDINLEVNMEKAREIWTEKIRAARDKALEDLDVPYMRAMEVEDKRMMQKISNTKQALRILPKNLDLSLYTNPQALKAYWPKELKGYE